MTYAAFVRDRASIHAVCVHCGARGPGAPASDGGILAALRAAEAGWEEYLTDAGHTWCCPACAAKLDRMATP